MKELFLIILIQFSFQKSFSQVTFNELSQRTTTKKNCFSINLFQIAVNREAGLCFDKNLSEEYGLEISYGHRFKNFNLIRAGGPNRNAYFPQTADIFRIGVKFFINKKNGLYFSTRLGYENTHTPKYWERQGSGGLDDTEIKYISVDKNLLNCTWVFGKEYYYNEHTFINIFFATGLCIGEKKTHYYGDSSIGNYPTYVRYNRDEHYYKTAFFPIIELGLKMGFRI